MRRRILILLMLFGSVAGAENKWIGYVSDLTCGKQVDADCNRRCIKGGQPPVLILDDTDEILSITNPDSLKHYPGQHVEVAGTRIDQQLTIDHISVLPAAGNRPAHSQTQPEFDAETVKNINRIENSDTPIPSFKLNLLKLMQVYRVPGVSIALIDHYKIAWAKGYGVTDWTTADAVTPRTLFMAGSVAKTPAAAGALYLVEQGKLSLDEDVNKTLKSWKLPDNEFTKTEKVTLRRILSHTSGTGIHFFPGYAVGQQLPSLIQVLDGAKPANTDAIRVESIPGSGWHYSGGGVLIEQQMMIDATRKPFPELMSQVLFNKIGMNDSTYEQPLPAARAAHAATGTYASGKPVRGKWHVYPEMAAGGLWTTPADLARFTIEIALSKKGKSNRILSQSMTEQMLTPQWKEVSEIALGNKQHVDQMGLGFFLGDTTRPDLFG
ncbi:MAG: hypothetical protein C5B54_02380, partial [Acidobacteria bacterium]